MELSKEQYMATKKDNEDNREIKDIVENIGDITDEICDRIDGMCHKMNDAILDAYSSTRNVVGCIVGVKRKLKK